MYFVYYACTEQSRFRAEATLALKRWNFRAGEVYFVYFTCAETLRFRSGAKESAGDRLLLVFGIAVEFAERWAT